MDVRATPLVDQRFLLLGRLGHGGMGTVYRAFDRVEQRLVAIKVEADTRPAGPGHPLAAEFEVWSRLRHPNVVEAYGLGIARGGPLAAGTPYLVLEHVPGHPLDRALRCGRIAPASLRRVGVELLRALDHVHAAGLVHRDLKPTNVLVGRRSEASAAPIKLTDFGLATPTGVAEEPGRISGSLPYLAPEVLLGRPLDCRCDLYSLGLVLYRLATGEPAVGGNDPDAVLRWHLAGPPADVLRLRPRLPRRLARFIRRLTCRDPDLRPRDARTAMELLGESTGGSVGARRASLATADRVRLRLGLDAARLGARRRVPLPADAAVAWRLRRQARVWAQVHGLGFHDLRTDPARLVLSLWLELGEATRGLVRRHGLDRWLPLALVAGQPLADPTRETAPGEAEMRALGRFLLDCSERRGLVLVAPRDGARRLVAALRRALTPPRPPTPGRGGLLLLDEVGSRSD